MMGFVVMLIDGETGASVVDGEAAVVPSDERLGEFKIGFEKRIEFLFIVDDVSDPVPDFWQNVV